MDDDECEDISARRFAAYEARMVANKLGMSAKRVKPFILHLRTIAVLAEDRWLERRLDDAEVYPYLIMHPDYARHFRGENAPTIDAETAAIHWKQCKKLLSLYDGYVPL